MRADGDQRPGERVLTFQSSEVTSLSLGTSWPPSRMQWRRTSWVELEEPISFRSQIRAVESPELEEAHTQRGQGSGLARWNRCEPPDYNPCV